MIVNRSALATALAAALLSPAAVAFAPPTSLARPSTSSSFSTSTSLEIATAPPSSSAEKAVNGAGGERSDPAVPQGWECDEEANCVAVEACDEDGCRTSLDVRIHGEWYDLSGWRKAHPAGSHWIDWYDGRDATEVMDAFHSEKARAMYQRLPKSVETTAQMLEAEAEPDTKTQVAFRELRDKLEKEGWWERDPIHEVKLLGIWSSLCVGAALTAQTAPPLSIFLTALAMTNAGWLGHDYVHGVDKWSDRLRLFVCYAAGLGCTWWSDKHNKHHALTNEKGVDEDIATDPFLYTWAPDPENDSPLRKIQHWTFFVPFSALFALWRVDTMKVAVEAVEQKRPGAKEELFGLLAHYFVLLTFLPFGVWFPAVFLSGLMSALIVTPTHQSEAMFEDYQPDWVTAQFMSTRNAVMTNPFSEWLWGGMQYQLEHHLFPSMPRSKYPLLKPILAKFAEENNIPGGYRESGEFEILKMNWDLYKEVAEADAVVGAPASRGNGQLGAINKGTSPAAVGFSVGN